MRQLVSFTKKEYTELFRTGKFLILLIIFILFGVMNPAMAKLTPWMMNLFSESLKVSGMMVSKVEVNALTSWTQFYKNIPMALIIYTLMFSGILTAEYQKGTLINMLTKGLPRWKVITAKYILVISFWSLCYWTCYGITYAYNAYFWDNSIAMHPFFSAFCIYLAGLWLFTTLILLSALFNSSSTVLASLGIIIAATYVLAIIPAVGKYLPVQLLSSSVLITGGSTPGNYQNAIIVTILLTVFTFAASILLFNRKRL